MAAHPHHHDILVIGSGAAGLTAALALAETRKVVVLAKGSLSMNMARIVDAIRKMGHGQPDPDLGETA